MNFEKGFLNLKEQSLRKVSKIMAAFVVAGIITFGPGTEGFKNIAAPSSPEKYIEYVEKQPGADEVKAEMLRGKLKFLEEKFSSRIIDYLMMGDRAAKENNQNIPSQPIISGFDKVGINNKDMGTLWSKKFYPVGAIENNIASINYLGNRAGNVPDYNIGGEAAAGARDFSDVVYFHNDGLQIESKKDLQDKIGSLDWHFTHELGHNTDWANQNKLTPVERVEFLHDIAKAFEKPGSFRDPLGYIDSINNPDKHKENYYKVREYWASLCEQYLSFPELSKDYLSKDETGLIKKWLEREDKEFNPIKAEKEKKILIETIVEKGLQR
jgi:hypothetical protein